MSNNEVKGIEVYLAINKVQEELAKEGITKNRKNVMQNYTFRGIDDCYNALSPLLAKHKLCILPRMLSRTITERETLKGGTLFYVVVEAEFDFVSAIDGSKHIVKTYGEAMDSSDKATNKAMSAAYKYAAFQSFAIPTEGEDNDADKKTHEVKPNPITKLTANLPQEEVEKPTDEKVENPPATEGQINALNRIMESDYMTGEERAKIKDGLTTGTITIDGAKEYIRWWNTELDKRKE